MATYKVLQDIEAEDKLLGPLTLKQFIYAGIAAICAYLSFFSIVKHAPFLLVVFFPPVLIGGFLAWPWSRDQPTEIWLLAKIRFLLKPRRRVWDQDGIQELVTITAPKHEVHNLTNGLSVNEVNSRLRALAETIDSRGWAIKNVNVNLYTEPGYAQASDDRLIDIRSLPQEVSSTDVTASDDMLDERNNPVAQHLDQLMNASTSEHRQELLKHMQAVRQDPNLPLSPRAAALTPSAPADLWFMQGQTSAPGYATFSSQVVSPGANDPTVAAPANISKQEEQALLAQLHPDDTHATNAYGHMKVIEPHGTPKPTPPANPTPPTNHTATTMTPAPDPVILELANNDDLNVATIARQAHKAQRQEPPDEVTISLR